MNFTILKDRLYYLRQNCIDKLKSNPQADVISEKKQIECLLFWIQEFEHHQISNQHKIVCLPPSSSVFRVIDENDTDNRELWTDLSKQDDSFILYPGDLILKSTKQ
jgi:hypothetical protein